MTEVNFTIDGIAVTVPKGTTVFTAAQNLGIDIPIFCYQDRMPPFGACRVCLVEVEKMAKPQTSCTLVATEGMVVKTQSSPAVQGRKDILEFLLINHPLDCPICDRGGECPLQEQTLKYGPGLSRFFEEKRHFLKPKPLGPVLMLDRERCIVCARCTRFGDIVAGDHALQFIERGFKTEVGTLSGKDADSKFIGNTIMICPVGALTSQVYRFRARPWDNDAVASTCTLCPVGCSLFLDSRDGEIMRTRSCENRQVNDIWLCDKGWFGYEFTSHPDRLKTPLIRKNGQLEEASWDEALDLIASKLKEAKPQGRIGAWGGDPLTVEENYLFQQLMRKVAEVEHFDHRIGEPLFTFDEEGLPPGMEMPIEGIDNLSHIYLLGLDITEEFPVIWLRVKQAINKGAKVHFIGHFSPEIAPHLASVTLHPPGSESEALKTQLKIENNGAIFVGRQYLALKNRAGLLAEIVRLKGSYSLNIMEGRGNSMGARFAGMRGYGLNPVQLLEASQQSGWDFLYIAGANPALKFPSALWHGALRKLGFLVVQDLFLTETAREAHVVLPTLSFVEKGGHFINIEGRVQKLLPGKTIPENLYSDGDIFTKIAHKFKTELALDPKMLETLEQGKIHFEKRNVLPKDYQAASPPLSLTFSKLLFDNGVRMNFSPHVSKLAKEAPLRIHPSEGEKRGLVNGALATLKTEKGALKAHLKFDDTVALNTIVVPLGCKHISQQELGSFFNGQEAELC